MKPKRPLVILEPTLELQACVLSPAERRSLARVYARWAHQLRVSAAILEAHAAPKPKRKLGQFPTLLLPLN
jgi:hypothetical protein